MQTQNAAVAAMFSRKRIETAPGAGEIWQVLSDQGAVVAQIGPDASAADWAGKIAFSLNATKIANADLLDSAASLIGASHAPGTSLARDLRAAARALCGGAPFATCLNYRDDCMWSGHVPAPEDAEYVSCPRCGESADIIRY